MIYVLSVGLTWRPNTCILGPSRSLLIRIYSRPLYRNSNGAKIGGYIGGSSFKKDKEESVDWVAIGVIIVDVIATEKKKARFTTKSARRYVISTPLTTPVSHTLYPDRFL
jgi:hypothetical protein